MEKEIKFTYCREVDYIRYSEEGGGYDTDYTYNVYFGSQKVKKFGLEKSAKEYCDKRNNK